MFRNFYHDFFDFPVMRRPISLIESGLRPRRIIYKPSLNDAENYKPSYKKNQNSKQLNKYKQRALQDHFENDFSDLINYINHSHNRMMSRSFNNFFKNDFFDEFEKDFFNSNFNKLDSEVNKALNKETKQINNKASNKSESKAQDNVSSQETATKTNSYRNALHENEKEKVVDNKETKDTKQQKEENKVKSQSNDNKEDDEFYATHVYSNTIIRNGKKVSKKTTILENYDGEKIIKTEEDLGDGKLVFRTQKFYYDENGTLVRELTEDYKTKEAIAENKSDKKQVKEAEAEDDITIEDIPLEKESKLSSKDSLKSELNKQI